MLFDLVEVFEIAKGVDAGQGRAGNGKRGGAGSRGQDEAVEGERGAVFKKQRLAS